MLIGLLTMALAMGQPHTTELNIDSEGFYYSGAVGTTEIEVTQLWTDEDSFAVFADCVTLEWAKQMAAGQPPAEPFTGPPLAQCIQAANATCGAGNVASLKIVGGPNPSCEFICKPTATPKSEVEEN